jgi:biopolymer transport protein TolR
MGSGGDELNSEINVTPFVDVMLVLLIIFMITAPMMNTGVALDLPGTTAKKEVSPEGKLVLSIAKNSKIFLGGTPVTWNDLEAKLKANPKAKAEGLYVEADTNLPYGVVVTAMAIANRADVPKVMMLTSPTDQIKLDQLDNPATAPIPGSTPAPLPAGKK